VNRFAKTLGVTALSGGLVLAVAACDTSTTNPAPSGGSSATTATVPGVTLAEYNQVANGMTYEQVSAIFRSPGTKRTDTNVAGYHHQIYTWNGTTDRSIVTVTFQNGMVVLKVQVGLS
jgi:hypothetical protein